MSSRQTPKILDPLRYVPPGVLPWSLTVLTLFTLLCTLTAGWLAFHLSLRLQLWNLCEKELTITFSRWYLLSHTPVDRWPLIEGAVMAPFSQVVAPALVPFWGAIAVMLGVVAYHYGYFIRESRSIYLMARLPSRWERHRRAWTLPILGILLCLLAALLFTLLCYAVYLDRTPAQCLPPQQWESLWR